MMRSRLATPCALALAVVTAAAPGCSGDDDTGGATAGCLAGNRSQCVMQFALGDHFGCARLHDGSVWCWGGNEESQLGYATTDLCPREMPNGMTQSVACHAYPFRVGGLDNVERVFAGGSFACALRTDGSVWCWGDNSAGQLGRGDTRSSMAPAPVTGLGGGVSGLGLGERHACAVVGGTLFCWGAGDAGQLGTGDASQLCMSGVTLTPCETSPHPVLGLGRTRSVVAGFAHTCAIAAGGDGGQGGAGNGSVSCWGANAFGQLGGGTAGEEPAPQPRPVMLGASSLTAVEMVSGGFHNCARRDGGAVLCWGRNDHGELGTPPARTSDDHCSVACSPAPLVVAGLPGAPPPMVPDAGAPPDLAGVTPPDLAVSAGIDAAVAPDMTLPGKPVTNSTTPPIAVAAGRSFSCALLGDGTARCWGADEEGQLGDGVRGGATADPAVVIAHPGSAAENPLVSITAIAGGAASACVRVAEGSLRCWGSNVTGALGHGDIAPVSGPVPVVW